MKEIEGKRAVQRGRKGKKLARASGEGSDGLKGEGNGL